MVMISIRDLPEQVSQAIENLQDGETIQIVNDDKIVAQIVLQPRRLTDEEIRRNLASLEELRQEIAKVVTEPTDVAALISSMRRF